MLGTQSDVGPGRLGKPFIFIILVLFVLFSNLIIFNHKTYITFVLVIKSAL